MLCRAVKLIYPLMYIALACNLTPSDGLLHPRVSVIKIFANHMVGERVRYASIYECVSFFFIIFLCVLWFLIGKLLFMNVFHFFFLSYSCVYYGL